MMLQKKGQRFPECRVNGDGLMDMVILVSASVIIVNIIHSKGDSNSFQDNVAHGKPQNQGSAKEFSHKDQAA